MGVRTTGQSPSGKGGGSEPDRDEVVVVVVLEVVTVLEVMEVAIGEWWW